VPPESAQCRAPHRGSGGGDNPPFMCVAFCGGFGRARLTAAAAAQLPPLPIRAPVPSAPSLLPRAALAALVP